MEGSIKAQVGDRIKRLLEKQYSSVDDLKQTIRSAFELSPSSSLALHYHDEENEAMTIDDSNDLIAALQAARRGGFTLKLKVVVDDSEPCPTLTTHTEVAESEVHEEPDQIMEELK